MCRDLVPVRLLGGTARGGRAAAVDEIVEVGVRGVGEVEGDLHPVLLSSMTQTRIAPPGERRMSAR
jgi:hypothetical protein